MTNEVANQNVGRTYKSDPSGPYVDDYLDKMLAHFRDCKIEPELIARKLTDAIFKVAPGSPYDKLPDAYDIEAGLSCLIPTASELDQRVEAYYKAQRRLHANRIETLAARHNCSPEEAHRLWVAEQQAASKFETGLPA